ASALATSAKPSNSASLAARSPTPVMVRPRREHVKCSSDYLTSVEPKAHHAVIGGRGRCTMATKLAAGEIAKLDPYKFMAVVGKRVIHPGGRASTSALLDRAHITADSRVLDVGCGVATTAVEIARQYGAEVTAVDIAPVMLERAGANVTAAAV